MSKQGEQRAAPAATEDLLAQQKICRSCLLAKQLEEFAKKRGQRDARCKLCRNKKRCEFYRKRRADLRFPETPLDVRFVIAKDVLPLEIETRWHGNMEFGPRALGNRSIIGDPRSPKMQSIMNLKIKFRESFRPFAPSVLQERASEFFDFAASEESPYMLLVADVRSKYRREAHADSGLWGIDRLNIPRSIVPAITHIDYSARLQTVREQTNPFYYAIIREFERITGIGMVINTSFNVRGEPIVCDFHDAYRCFLRTNMDYLVLENFVLDKRMQPAVTNDSDWRREYTLD